MVSERLKPDYALTKRILKCAFTFGRTMTALYLFFVYGLFVYGFVSLFVAFPDGEPVSILGSRRAKAGSTRPAR